MHTLTFFLTSSPWTKIFNKKQLKFHLLFSVNILCIEITKQNPFVVSSSAHKALTLN